MPHPVYVHLDLMDYLVTILLHVDCAI